MTRRAANGDGSLYQIKTGPNAGKWAGALSIAGRRRVVYGQDREDARVKLTALLSERDKGILPTGRQRTVAQYLALWLEDSAKPSVKPSTFRRYRQIVDHDLIPALGKTGLVALTPVQVQRAINEKAAATSGRTASHMRAVLRTALNQAVAWRMVSQNVAELTKRPKITEYEPVVFDSTQAAAFLAGIRGDRLEALYTAALGLGLRQAEVIGLRWRDLALDDGYLRVSQTIQTIDREIVIDTPKTPKSRRTLNLPAFVTAALKRQRDRQAAEREAAEHWVTSDLVFTSTIGTPVDAANLRREFARIIKRLKLPKMRFYDLRHSCATLLLDQGVDLRDIMDILGHSQISLTANTYTRLLQRRRSAAAAAMDQAVTPKLAVVG